MRAALATVCSLDAALETIVEDYAAGHCNAVDLWLGHAERFLETHSANDLRELLERHGIAEIGRAHV